MGGPDQYHEWFFQSEYDLETAEAMFVSGRYIYAIFMCHLSLEKALKGIYLKRTNEQPPRSHDLVYFVQKSGLTMDPEHFRFIANLNRLSVPTRYPEDLSKLIHSYTKERTRELLDSTKTILEWIGQQ